MKPIMMMRKMGLAAMALLLLGGNAPAQTGGVRQGAAQKDAAQQYGPLRPGVPQRVDMQWWQDSHYRLFLHMGLYTVAGGEWKGKGGFGEFIQLNNKIPVAEMREEAKRFNPVQFDANEWVAAARRAGMKYIVMGSKHHEGFAMFDSPCNDFNVVKATPFGRDIIGELAAACPRQGYTTRSGATGTIPTARRTGPARADAATTGTIRTNAPRSSRVISSARRCRRCWSCCGSIPTSASCGSIRRVTARRNSRSG